MKEAIKDTILKQRKFFSTTQTRAIDFRIKQLKKLRAAIQKNESSIIDALQKDLGKPPFEAYASEIHLILTDINHALKHLATWSKPKKVHTPFTHFPGKSYIVPEPRGVVLIMAPWNYPVQLTLLPLVGAIAAGNCAIIKPSEHAPHASAIIAKIIHDTFDPEFISVIEGEVEVSKKLLEEQYDYILFTGSMHVGKIVMEAAAQHLTPVTLELGGKSPCIITETASLDCAAKRIVWGKFFNAGQNCVAPDYVFIKDELKNKFIDLCKKYIHQFFGKDPEKSQFYGRIINQQNFERLSSMLDQGTIVLGGKTDKEKRYIAPTLIDNVDVKSAILNEEIFGPLLPIVSYNTLSDAISFITKHSIPLALYIFSTNKKEQKHIMQAVQSGGVCINDTLLQASTSELPFGGLGLSGFGKYHGKASFDTFSHMRSLFTNSCWYNLELRFPPYNRFINKVTIKWLRFSTVLGKLNRWIKIGMTLLIIAILLLAYYSMR